MSGIVKLEATPERIAVWNRCFETKEDKSCSGCPYRYKCEDYFPDDTPWGRFTLPTDYHREGDYFIIEEK